MNEWLQFLVGCIAAVVVIVAPFALVITLGL